MDLASYMKREGLDDAAFGAIISLDRSAVYRYRRGERQPGWDVMGRIVIATKGEVLPSDFLRPEYLAIIGRRHLDEQQQSESSDVG